jgi:hypothetical protein
MPPEWAPHDATWISWPCNRETWPADLAIVQERWVEMMRHLSPHERVHILVNDDEEEQAVREQDFTKAGELRDKEVELREQIRSILQTRKDEEPASEAVAAEAEFAYDGTYPLARFLYCYVNYRY